jgi:hypothetical protein
MAFYRSERGHRLERYPRPGESERDRKGRGHNDQDFYDPRDVVEEGDYASSSDRRYGRRYDDYLEKEFERDRDYRSFDRLTQRPLEAQHRERFLRRRGDNDAGAGIGPWHGREGWNEDWSGPYAGRGPKGYRRSDERIQEDICERLTEHPSIDASDIEVTVGDGDVTLTGRVESRAVKHLTEVMVETVSGVKEVHNQLRIGPLDQNVPTAAELPQSRAREPIVPKTRRRGTSDQERDSESGAGGQSRLSRKLDGRS